jgi:MoaA/NifB/PqqE/SkfB family radical SAM enzyme
MLRRSDERRVPERDWGQRAFRELTTSQVGRLIAELTIFPRPPLLVFTGGDPLTRDDV